MARGGAHPESRAFGSYTLLGKLGAGGMGEVHLAHDPKLDRKVALKLLPEALRQRPERRRLFLREARAVAQLNHPHITTIHEIGEVEGRDFIAFEHVDGETLREVLAERRLAPQEVVDLALALADALEFAHEHGIVHRDIKPANVMVTRRGHVKLLDFGLAKLLDPDASPGAGEAPAHATTTLSGQGGLYGTPAAMSPEQARGRPIDARSDVFSFGSLLYEMATGRPAFEGKSAWEVIDAVIHRQPAGLDPQSDELPAELAEILGRALRKDPDERFQGMADFSAALRAYGRTLDGERLVAAPLKTRKTRKTRMRGWLLACAAGVVVAALAYSLRGREHAGRAPVLGTSSIAVLPFVDMSPAGDMQYFGDGMAEEIIDDLTRSTDLRVAGRTSAFSFRGDAVDLKTIGEALGVSSVLEGSVRRSGSRLRVTARLSLTDDQSQVWSETFQRSFDEDVFEIQDQISQAIVGTLAARLTGRETTVLARRGTYSPAAYDAFLRGRFEWNEHTQAGLARSIEELKHAVELDSNFARAYAALAEAYAIASNHLWLRPDLAFFQARTFAHQALELEPDLADAHRAQAAILTWYDWDWEEAEREYRRALELNPDDAFTRYWYSVLLDLTNRPEEGEAQVLQAAALDPLALQIRAGVGDHYRYVGERERAIEVYNEILEQDPGFVNARHELAETLVLSGRYRKALDVAESLRPYGEAHVRAAAWAGLGERSEALRWLALAEEPQGLQPDYLGIARAWAALDDLDQAYSWIERGLRARSYQGLDVAEFARLDASSPLGRDARFAKVLARLDLARFWNEG